MEHTIGIIILAIFMAAFVALSYWLAYQEPRHNKALAMAYILMVQSKADWRTNKPLFTSLDRFARTELKKVGRQVQFIQGISLFIDTPADVYNNNVRHQQDFKKRLKETEWKRLNNYSFDKKRQHLLNLLEIAHAGAEPTEQTLNLLDFLRTNAFKLNQATYAKIESFFQNKRRQQNQNAQPRKA